MATSTSNKDGEKQILQKLIEGAKHKEHLFRIVCEEKIQNKKSFFSFGKSKNENKGVHILEAKTFKESQAKLNLDGITHIILIRPSGETKYEGPKQIYDDISSAINYTYRNQISKMNENLKNHIKNEFNIYIRQMCDALEQNKERINTLKILEEKGIIYENIEDMKQPIKDLYATYGNDFLEATKKNLTGLEITLDKKKNEFKTLQVCTTFPNEHTTNILCLRHVFSVTNYDSTNYNLCEYCTTDARSTQSLDTLIGIYITNNKFNLDTQQKGGKDEETQLKNFDIKCKIRNNDGTETDIDLQNILFVDYSYAKDICINGFPEDRINAVKSGGFNDELSDTSALDEEYETLEGGGENITEFSPTSSEFSFSNMQINKQNGGNLFMKTLTNYSKNNENKYYLKKKYNLSDSSVNNFSQNSITSTHYNNKQNHIYEMDDLLKIGRF